MWEWISNLPNNQVIESGDEEGDEELCTKEANDQLNMVVLFKRKTGMEMVIVKIYTYF